MLYSEAEFNKRDAEIDEYLKYVEGLESGVAVSVTLLNTMKSSVLLMLYNQVESTMANLLQDIFDELEREGVHFDSLSQQMKSLVLNYCKRRSPASLVQRMYDDSLGLVPACFDRADLFSGNIDCQKIRETMKELGVKARHRYSEVVLKDVKEKRNDLAHGNASFSDCGKGYTAKQLRDVHSKTQAVLVNAIDDLKNFISSKSYC